MILFLAAAIIAAQHAEHGAMPSSTPAEPSRPQPADSMAGMDMGSGDPATRHSAGALGSYPMSRDASGTAWQPDASPHRGLHAMAGGWMLMAHAMLNGVYDRQEGRRGGDKAFLSGMAMGVARRSFGDGSALQLRAMLSPEPLMSRSGYPLLLASGETANGRTPLIDHQHPHDFLMELSASYSIPVGRASLFLYGGLPAEPAFGPPAFMHRLSILDSPEAPITHHWLDSTHISYGVVTAGLVAGRVKIEASRFNGREPDQHRWDIEAGPLDSTAFRLSWNPSDRLALQASWAHLSSPEQLDPGEAQTRWSASALYTQVFGAERWWSTTLAWGRRSSGARRLDAAVAETALHLEAWTLFGRAEYTENDELAAGIPHDPVPGVGKLSFGAVRDFPVAPHASVGLGALYAFDFVPRALKPLYGATPRGGMAFVRLKID
jgi:hypothetical protein